MIVLRKVVTSAACLRGGQTVWLNQKQLADLFGKAKGMISEHIKHIFEDEELAQEATVRLFR